MLPSSAVIPAKAGIHGRLSWKLPGDIRPQIASGWVLRVDQIQLPRAVPLLDPLFPFYCRLHRVVLLEPHQSRHPVAMTESVDCMLAMLPDAGDEIAGHAEVKSAVTVTRKQVHARLSSLHRFLP